MTLEKLLTLANVKELQAKAYLSFLIDKKVDLDNAQIAVDAYCEKLSQTFISENKNVLDKKTLIELKKYICDIGANNPHSGHRFYEALYKNLNNNKNKNLEDDIKSLN